MPSKREENIDFVQYNCYHPRLLVIDTTVHSLRKWLAPNAVRNLWWLQFYNLYNVRVQMHNKSWVYSIVWPKNLNFQLFFGVLCPLRWQLFTLTWGCIVYHLTLHDEVMSFKKEGQGQETRAACRQSKCLVKFWSYLHTDHCTTEASEAYHCSTVEKVQAEFDRVMSLQ